MIDCTAFFAVELSFHTALFFPTKAAFVTNSREVRGAGCTAPYIASFAAGNAQVWA
ncbi:hypothetical protein [Roseateles sp.]|uniref:hypothetical protein n=1 Tax=Roseateles sp. TaxID=1971397 RepID=UPI003BAA2BC8